MRDKEENFCNRILRATDKVFRCILIVYNVSNIYFFLKISEIRDYKFLFVFFFFLLIINFNIDLNGGKFIELVNICFFFSKSILICKRFIIIYLISILINQHKNKIENIVKCIKINFV